jgi:hypothetical protein
MAKTTIPVELSSTPGITDNSNATAITIDANEKVGIGTGSASHTLHVNSGTSNVVARFESSDSIAVASFKDNGGEAEIGNIGNDVGFFPAGAEKARLTSGGNFGINTTSPSTALEVNNASAGATVATFEGDYSASGDVKLASFERNGGAVAAAITYADAATAMEFGTTTSHSLILTTGDTERMRIDSSGNVNIGGTGLAYKLAAFVSANASFQNAFTLTNNANADLFVKIKNDETNLGTTAGSCDMSFSTANAERMRIESTGEVHITSAGAAISPSIKYGGATGDYAKLRLINRSGQGANKGGVLELGGVTNDGVTRSDVFAALHGGKDNATSGNKAGYLDFHTSNGASLDQRMRLTSNGELLMGDTSLRGTNQRGQIQVTQISSSNAAGISAISGNDEIAGTFCLYSSSTASAMISVDPDSQRASSAFYVWIDGSERMSLNSSGNLYVTGSYSNSDRALKENIVTLPNQLEKVKQLNPVSFDWKEKTEDGSTQSSIGFVAQEVEELYPNLVTKPEEDTDAEQGSRTKYKTLNYPVMVSILTKAIQEQQEQIETLKQEIREIREGG